MSEHKLKLIFQPPQKKDYTGEIDWQKTFTEAKFYDKYIPPHNYQEYIRNGVFDYPKITKAFKLVNPDRFWDHQRRYPLIEKLIDEAVVSPNLPSDFIILAVPDISLLSKDDLKKIQLAIIMRIEKQIVYGFISDLIVSIQFLCPYFQVNYEFDASMLPEIFRPEHIANIDPFPTLSAEEQADHLIRIHSYNPDLAKKISVQYVQYRNSITKLHYLNSIEVFFKK